MTEKQRKFWTGMITCGDEARQPRPPFKGAGWKAHFAPQRRSPTRVFGGKEIVLHARTWFSAQRALDLIDGCHQLLRGDPPVFPVQLIAHNKIEPEWMEPEQRATHAKEIHSTTGFPLACSLAAKASHRRHWVYAVQKYKFSLSLYSVLHMDMEPWKARHLAVSSFPSDHIMFSHAIISAYSVVEELNLKVGASQGRPSRINGQWNPAVKADLEKRLKASGVDVSEPILWMMRGPRRKIESKRTLPPGDMAPWSARIVRDSEIPIIDAVAYAEWLRSCVASHGAKDLTSVLSPYDVANVQHVARRLLLESLGFWRWH